MKVRVTLVGPSHPWHKYMDERFPGELERPDGAKFLQEPLRVLSYQGGYGGPEKW